MKYVTQDTRLVQKSRNAGGRAELLREMILNRLLEEPMRQEGLLPQDRTLDAKEYMQTYPEVGRQVFFQVRGAFRGGAYQYYEKNPELYGIPPMVRIGQISFRFRTKPMKRPRRQPKPRPKMRSGDLRLASPSPPWRKRSPTIRKAESPKGDLGFQPDKDEWLRKAVRLGRGPNLRVLEIAGRI